MHQWQEGGNTICISAVNKITKKKEISIRHHLKTMTSIWKLGFLQVIMHLCICVFSKEITALVPYTFFLWKPGEAPIGLFVVINYEEVKKRNWFCLCYRFLTQTQVDLGCLHIKVQAITSLCYIPLDMVMLFLLRISDEEDGYYIVEWEKKPFTVSQVSTDCVND